MALIKCPECGKEISDKAMACINCGCPVSAMKQEAAEPKQAKPETINFTDVFQEFFTKKPTAQMKTVPKEMPEMKLLPGIIVQALGKFCGMAGLAGFGALAATLIEVLQGKTIEPEAIPITASCIAAAFILAYLKQLITFRQAKKFLQENDYENSIRNDSPSLTNSLNAFHLYPGTMMARYIRSLNPTAGSALEMAIAEGKAKRKKKRLENLPYFVILLAAYYLLPRFEAALHLPYESALLVLHLITLMVMIVYGHKKPFNWRIAVTLAVLFAPAVFAYYYYDMWYHILICAASAFAGMLIGLKIRKKK